MANTSVTNYVLYSAYAGEGLAISIGNGLLFLTIALEKSLRKRKEMRIIAALCVADFVYGFGGLLLNGYRVLLMAIGLSGVPSTAWDCIKWPHIFFAQIGGQLTAFMNLAVSVDRFVAVSYPVTYHKLSLRYATAFISAFFAYFVLSGGAMLASTYFEPAIFSKFNLMCVGAPFAAWYVLYHYTFIVVAGALGVIVYLGVFFSYRLHMSPAGSESGSRSRVDDKQVKAQRRLTVTLGLITISTLIFYIAPFSVVAYFFYLSISAPASVTVALAMLCRLSTIVNIIIYVYRQKEIRPGMWKIVTCKWSKVGEVQSISVSGRSSTMTNKIVTLRLEKLEKINNIEHM